MGLHGCGLLMIFLLPPPLRAGKSLITTFLTGITDELVFDLGHTTRGKTRGLYACCVESATEVLVVIDSEGLADTAPGRVRTLRLHDVPAADFKLDVHALFCDRVILLFRVEAVARGCAQQYVSVQLACDCLPVCAVVFPLTRSSSHVHDGLPGCTIYSQAHEYLPALLIIFPAAPTA